MGGAARVNRLWVEEGNTNVLCSSFEGRCIAFIVDTCGACLQIISLSTIQSVAQMQKCVFNS